MNELELCYRPATELARDIATKRLSPVEIVDAFWDEVRPLFERFDLLLTPTMPIPAFELRRNTPWPVEGRLVESLAWSFFTYPFNLTGQPAANLPCGFTSDGLPIGLQVIGRRHADATVLRASAVFEAAAPWLERRPQL